MAQYGEVLSSAIVCPSCSRYTDTLVDSTGWCIACSTRYCHRCGNYQNGNRTDKYCGTCRDEVWLEENAGALEIYTSKGLTLREAKEKVLEDNRPFCISCGKRVPHGKKGITHFCTRTSACRRARRRFRTLRQYVPPEVALQKVQQEQLALREA